MGKRKRDDDSPKLINQHRNSQTQQTQTQTKQSSAAITSPRFIFGGLAGIVAKTFCAPIERVKLLAQTGFGSEGPLVTIENILRKEGFVGFWRGNFINCVRVFPNKGILFATNDIYKEFISKTISNSQQWVGFLTGSLAGCTAVLCTYPLDLVRTRRAGILGGRNVRYSSIHSTVITIVSKNGPLGLYNGASVTMLGAIPYEALKFGLYPMYRDLLLQWSGEHKNTIPGLIKLGAGSMTGISASLIVYHLDTVRRVRQVSGASGMPELNNIFVCYQYLWRQGGIRRLYQGVLVNIMRIIPNTALQFWVYETLKENYGD